MVSRRSKGLLLLILLMVPSLLSDVPFNTAMGQPSEGSISFQPSEMPNLTFDYNPTQYRFELTWKGYYLHLEPFAIYNGNQLELYEIIPWLQNNYPQVDYRWAVTKFKNYNRWGYWLENLPQDVADNLDYLGFRLDYNFPLSAVEIEWVETPNYTFPRIELGKVITLDFSDLYEHGFTLEANKTHLMIGNVKGKTDLDLDPITYSSPTITVTGYTNGVPCTFWDVWNASNVNVWDVVHNNQVNDTQYQFDAKLQIGDGVTETWFNDTNKQVFFSENCTTANGQNFIHVTNNAHLRIGYLEDADLKVTSRGCSFIFNSSYNICKGINGLVGSSVELYSSLFEGLNNYVRVVTKANSRIWNCLFQYAQPVSTVDTDFYNVHIATNSLESCSGTFEKIFVTSYSVALIFYHDLGGPTLTDFYSRDIFTNLMTISNPRTVNTYLINADVEGWIFNYVGVENSTGEVYRQYTFDCRVVDKDGSPIQNADVTLTYSGQGGGTAYSDVTPANGSIPEQTISKGFYNQTGGDTIYPYEPYNLTVSALGYDTESFTFNISEPTSWVIGLRESVIDVEIVNAFNLELLLFAGLALIATLGAFLGSAIIGAIAGGFGLFLWYFTAQWWMIQQAGASTTVFAYVFYMLAIVSVFMAMKNVLEIYNEITRKGGYE